MTSQPTDSPNEYEQYGSQHGSRSTPRVSRKQAQLEALQKVREERGKLATDYRRMRLAWKELIIRDHDPEGRLANLIRWGRTLKPSEAARLIAAVKEAAWLCRGHPDLRFLALVELDALICGIRHKAGQDALSDPIPDLLDPEKGEGLTAFWVLKNILAI